MNRLQDKVVLFAGLGPIFGRAAAILFAQEGARVALAARSQGETAAVAAHIRSTGGEALVLQANVSQLDDARRVVGQTLDAYGRLDVLVNVAGDYWWRVSDLATMEAAYYQEALLNNLNTVFGCSQAAIPALERSGAGVILNFGSAAKTRLDGSVVYSASKLGIVGFTQGLARELHPRNVRVNCLCPGFMRDSPEIGPVSPPRPLLTRRGRAEDVAYAALYLVSDEAGWVTGQTLAVDGGDEVQVKSEYEQW